MKPFRISRRQVLRGIGGVGVGLPVLEAMTPRQAHAATPPTRFILAYGGSSMGTDGGALTVVPPKTAGAAWESTLGMAPVDALGMRGHVGLASKLRIPWTENGVTPPGGRTTAFHGGTLVPQATGRKHTSRDAAATGPSADQIVAAAIGTGSSHQSLFFRVQPVSYAGGTGGNRGRLSSGAGGKVIDPIVSPRLAYQSLFASFTPTGTGGAPATPAENIDQLLRKSVLSLVKGETERLLPKLSKSDKIRMQRHFDEIRDLESRVLAASAVGAGAPGAGPAAATAGCARPADPGADPPIGKDHSVAGGQLTFTANAGYSNEELRATVLNELVAMAFACNLTRVASVMYTLTQCFMSMVSLTGKQSDLHEMGHGKGNNDDVANGVAWHVKHFATLAKRLKALPETDGKSVLDYTAMVMFFEGGHGFDPETGRAVDAHSSENMIVVTAGHAGGFKGGDHVIASNRHPAEVIYTAMQAVGVTTALGDIATPIAALRT